MNKWQKILRIVALIVFSAIATSANAMIGQTPDQVTRDANRDKDTVNISKALYGHTPALHIWVHYRDDVTIDHVFGGGGYEIACLINAPNRLTNEAVFKMQRMYKTQWYGTGVANGMSSYRSASGINMHVMRNPSADIVWIINVATGNEFFANVSAPAPAATQPQYLSTDPNAGLPTQPAPKIDFEALPDQPPKRDNVPPAIDPGKRDCLIVATEAYARLKNTSYWAKIAGFMWLENGKMIGGHAVVFYQPTQNSNVWMYDAGGSYEIHTKSHELGEITSAFNQLLSRTTMRIEAPRWLESDDSRNQFASSKSDRQPVWWNPTPTPTEQTTAYLIGSLIGRLGLSLIILGLFVWAIVVCFLKGKPGFGTIGIIGLFLGVFSLWSVIGAIRIAKPHSRWARKKYGPEKMAIAFRRFTPFYNQAQEAVPVIIDDPVERALERVRRKQAII